MRKLIFLSAIAVLTFFCAASARGADTADAILGSWLTEDKDARFDFQRCGQEYCGKISGLLEPLYPPNDRRGMGGKPRIDRKNPDPAMRNRPLLGLTIFEHLRFDEGSAAWWGTVYNPDDGRTYKCRIAVAENGEALKVRGYIGMVLFGQTQTFSRQSLEPAKTGATPAALPPG